MYINWNNEGTCPKKLLGVKRDCPWQAGSRNREACPETCLCFGVSLNTHNELCIYYFEKIKKTKKNNFWPGRSVAGNGFFFYVKAKEV